MVGVFVPLVALVGATRLARPSSPWATRRYGEAKRRRAQARFGADRPLSRAWRRANDLLAGAPSDERSLVAPVDQRGGGDEDDAPGHEREQAEHPGAQGERMVEGHEQRHAGDAE